MSVRPIDRIVPVFDDEYDRLHSQFDFGEKEVYYGKDGDVRRVIREDDRTIWDTNGNQVVKVSEVLAIVAICQPAIKKLYQFK